jgi:hypothetical protein
MRWIGGLLGARAGARGPGTLTSGAGQEEDGGHEGRGGGGSTHLEGWLGGFRTGDRLWNKGWGSVVRGSTAFLTTLVTVNE